MKKRLLAWILVLAMSLGLLPAAVAADGTAAAQGDPTPKGLTPIYEDTQYSFAERAADLVARMSVAQKGSQLVSIASAIPAEDLGGGALNVPATKDLSAYYWWNEGLHGYNRIDNGASPTNNVGPANAVSYPQSLTAGSTWNPELYYKEARQVSDEIRERVDTNALGNGVNLNFYSPTINLQRDPRWGRNEESYSEDVFLDSAMGTQYVLGLEGKTQDGEPIDPKGYIQVSSTIKHYTANNSEANRLNGGATTDLRALREYYTAPYRNVIAATDVGSVMTAYSTVNSEPASLSSYLMDTLLRQTFGFSGVVTSDCDSVGTMSRHNYVNPHTGAVLTDVERMSQAMSHGEDLECDGGYTGTGNYGTYATALVDAGVETDKGVFSENTMDVALARLMAERISLGEFDDDLSLSKAATDRVAAQKAAEPTSDVYNQTSERLDLVDQVNEEGVVLLQNTGSFLPLNIPASGDYKVVIVGAWQTNMYLGLYSATENISDNHINIQKGITDAIQAKRPDATFTYITSDTLTADDEAAIAAADVVVAVAGTTNSYSAEDRDRATTVLPGDQDAMIAKVGGLNANTIAVLETCGPMTVSGFKDSVKAILWSSYGGLHKGVGFGNIITGAVNPSGKLTATWYQSDDDMPNTLDYNLYSSDESNGRTYMYYDGENAPQYPFGYGLSYTTFAYSGLTIDKTAYDANDTVTVRFKVKNTGTVAGKEVTQLYIAQPDAPAALNRPIRQLKGFEKVELEPGETKTVTMEVSIPDLAFFNEEDQCYQVDTGKYQVQVGGSSATANLTKNFTVSGTMDVYPELLTVKANQAGDTEQGIEERLIYDKGQTINPQLTVCMNDESLYGYIIADQMSPIHAQESTELPAGMTFTYSSNRPEVVSVEGDTIKAVGAGVATVTVTGTLDGHTVTADFVAYVEASPYVDDITVDGKSLSGFDREIFAYDIPMTTGAAIPEVKGITANPEITVENTQATAIPGVAKVHSVNTSSTADATYRVGFGPVPVSTDFSKGKQEIQDKGWTALHENSSAVFDDKGLTITTQDGSIGGANPPNNLYLMPAFGDWAAQTQISLGTDLSADGQNIGMTVYEDDDNNVQFYYEQVTGHWGSYTWKTKYLSVVTVSNGLATTNRTTISGDVTDLSLRVMKAGSTYTFAYALNGKDFTDLTTKASLPMANPQIGPYAVSKNGAEAKTVTYDGISIMKTSDLYPALATLTVDGKPLSGFDPNVYLYNLEIAKGTTSTPVLAATAAQSDQTVTITQLTGPTGTAQVKVSSPYTAKTYTVSFNYGPEDDYFADGTVGSLWSVAREDPSAYQIEQGKGVVLPTLVEDFYTTGDGWKNVFTMPAQGNFTAVAKVVYPHVPTANYQQGIFAIWQDADNYVRINCQESRLSLEPAYEVGGSFSSTGMKTATAVAAADGTVTLYFRINKKENEYSLSFSQDGASFQDLGKVTLALADPKLVLAAGQNSAAPQMDVYFEYLAITSRNGVDANAEYLQWADQNVADYVAAALPDKTDKNLTFAALPHGYTMNVTSSNPGAVANDGTVTRDEKDAAAVVTITATDGSRTATATKTVTVVGYLTEADTAAAAAEEAKIAAENAQKAADAAAAEAEKAMASQAADKAPAQAAQVAADKAQAAATAAKDAADKAQQAADAAKAAAAAKDEEALKQAVTDTKTAAQAAKDAAAEAAAGEVSAQLQALAQTTQKTAEDAQAAADEAQKIADEAKTAADALKGTDGEADAAQAAQAAQSAADAAKTAAKDAQDAANLAKAAAEKSAAETTAAAAQAAEYAKQTAQAQKALAQAEKQLIENAATPSDDTEKLAAQAALAAAKHAAATKLAQAAAGMDTAGFNGEQQKALSDAVNAGLAAIDAATTKADVDKAAAAAVAAIAAAKDACPSAGFADVPENAWFHSYVDYVVSNKLMNGLSTTEFAPNMTTNRAMLATVLYRMAQEPATTGTQPFGDVVKGSYYETAVAWAYGTGVVTGKTATAFDPTGDITREQMVAMLYRYAKLQGVDVGRIAPLTAFSDASSVAAYAKDAMGWAVSAKIITGKTDTTLVPGGNATRAEIATVLTRFSQLING